jgi:hypothetical protein
MTSAGTERISRMDEIARLHRCIRPMFVFIMVFVASGQFSPGRARIGIIGESFGWGAFRLKFSPGGTDEFEDMRSPSSEQLRTSTIYAARTYIGICSSVRFVQGILISTFPVDLETANSRASVYLKKSAWCRLPHRED